MKQYISWLKKNNYSANTIRTYSSILSKYEDKMGDIRLLKKEVLSYSNSPNTCILHYNVLFTYMKWTNDKRIKILQALKLPQIPIIYREVFTKIFLYKKTEILENDNDLLVKKKMTIRFLYETGIRASELNQIKEINDKYLVILGKGNKKRSVFYNKKTLKYFYPFEFTTKTLRLWVKEILGDIYTPHSIRRSFATHLLLKGASPRMVQLQMGHVKIETTFSYLNLSLNENAKIYNKYF
jgi:integrase/recombinase XerD